jgi:hypothetical protein
MSTAVMGMPLKAVEKAALAATPAARTFQRWLGKRGGGVVFKTVMSEIFSRRHCFENQIIFDPQSLKTG